MKRRANNDDTAHVTIKDGVAQQLRAAGNQPAQHIAFYSSIKKSNPAMMASGCCIYVREDHSMVWTKYKAGFVSCLGRLRGGKRAAGLTSLP